MFTQPVPFRHLFPNENYGLDDEELAREVGAPFGPMYSSGQGGNPRIAAGFTYLGQMIDHDLSFDPTPSFKLTRSESVQNFRTSAVDLDSLYGGGPIVSPHFYDVRARKFRLREDRFDLPRLGKTAVIADPRNDENIIVSQLLTAFLNFHNEVADLTEGPFNEVQRLVQWHYQWMVLHEYLPLITGKDVKEILDSRSPWPQTTTPFTPFEFSLAAVRFGHSQIRGQYDLNSDALGKGHKILPDLAGRRPPNTYEMIDWSFFFQFVNGPTPQQSMPIQPFLSFPLLSMPRENMPSAKQEIELSLAYRDLRRGQVYNLASGHDIAARMNLAQKDIVPAEAIWTRVRERLKQSGSKYQPPDSTAVPLWLYLLFEAEAHGNNGSHLGPLAATIVSAVVATFLREDSDSFLARQPDWKPSLGQPRTGTFSITDLLRLARNQQDRAPN
jgi:hypothetical protein